MADFTLTTTGLRGTPTAVSKVLAANWAIAAGTVNAITAVYDPENTALPDGLLLGFRASGRNTTTTPTFSPDGLTAHTITRLGGLALNTGDIPAEGAECLVRYNSDDTRWELLNPATRRTVGEVTTTRAVNATLAATDMGVIQDVTVDGVVLTLPATSLAGVFLVRNAGTSDGAVGLSVSPNASDKIVGNNFTALDNKDAVNTKATAKRGDLIVLLGDGVHGWTIREIVGTWARET